MNLKVLSIECDFQFSLSEFVMFYIVIINIFKFRFKNSIQQKNESKEKSVYELKLFNNAVGFMKILL